MANYRVMQSFHANSLFYPIGTNVNEYEFSLPVLRALEASGKVKIIETMMHIPAMTTEYDKSLDEIIVESTKEG